LGAVMEKFLGVMGLAVAVLTLIFGPGLYH
jgi:hypothetical protein